MKSNGKIFFNFIKCVFVFGKQFLKKYAKTDAKNCSYCHMTLANNTNEQLCFDKKSFTFFFRLLKPASY